MSVLSICSMLVLLLQFSTANASDSQQKALRIIWNTQTQGKFGCEDKFNIPVNVRKYGMEANEEPRTDGWRGEVISIVYQETGLWPFIRKNGTWKDGGVPQLGNITAHLENVTADINAAIPNPEFSGLGVLDFEEWFPVWDMNFDNNVQAKHKKASIELVKKNNPQLTDKEAEEKAIEEFDQYARMYFNETLLHAKKLRPKAKWGYYIFPKCVIDEVNHNCKKISFDIMDKLKWLAEASDALYPSGYIFVGTKPDIAPIKVPGAVEVSRAWLRSIGQPHKPIYVYSKTALNGEINPPFYTDLDLIVSLGSAADLGVNGIIIWGNNYRKKDSAQCERERDYLDTKLGPYVQRLLYFFETCSTELCSSNGRCIKREVEIDPSKIDDDLDKDHVYESTDVKTLYDCGCYKGWAGEDCSQAE